MTTAITTSTASTAPAIPNATASVETPPWLLLCRPLTIDAGVDVDDNTADVVSAAVRFDAVVSATEGNVNSCADVPNTVEAADVSDAAFDTEVSTAAIVVIAEGGVIDAAIVADATVGIGGNVVGVGDIVAGGGFGVVVAAAAVGVGEGVGAGDVETTLNCLYCICSHHRCSKMKAITHLPQLVTVLLHCNRNN
jgi:hypothetical protein